MCKLCRQVLNVLTKLNSYMCKSFRHQICKSYNQGILWNSTKNILFIYWRCVLDSEVKYWKILRDLGFKSSKLRQHFLNDSPIKYMILYFAIPVPADVSPPCNARPLAGTLITKKFHISLKFLCLFFMNIHFHCPDNITELYAPHCSKTDGK